MIGECVLNSRLDFGAALVVGEARRCYLVVIYLEHCSLGGVLRSDPLYVITEVQRTKYPHIDCFSLIL